MLAYTCALVERAKSELANLKADRKGVTALEYGLMAGLVSLAIVTAAIALGGAISDLFSRITTALTGVAPA